MLEHGREAHHCWRSPCFCCQLSRRRPNRPAISGCLSQPPVLPSGHPARSTRTTRGLQPRVRPLIPRYLLPRSLLQRGPSPVHPARHRRRGEHRRRGQPAPLHKQSPAPRRAVRAVPGHQPLPNRTGSPAQLNPPRRSAPCHRRQPAARFPRFRHLPPVQRLFSLAIAPHGGGPIWLPAPPHSPRCLRCCGGASAASLANLKSISKCRWFPRGSEIRFRIDQFPSHS